MNRIIGAMNTQVCTVTPMSLYLDKHLVSIMPSLRSGKRISQIMWKFKIVNIGGKEQILDLLMLQLHLKHFVK